VARPLHPFDAMHGTDTGGLIPAERLRTGSPADAHVTAYYAIAPSILRSLVELWQTMDGSSPIPQTTFIDIGAGKGRAMLLASEFGFRAVLGVELNPKLAAIAQDNLHRVGMARSVDPTAEPISPAEVLVQDAAALKLPHGPCVLFLFHPFEDGLLRRFLRRMEAQQNARQEPQLDLIYGNAEHAKVLDAHPAFDRLWFGRIPMSPADHVADLAEIAEQKEYGSTGDEECAIYRYAGRSRCGVSESLY
jgi:SAM-dependent methyltransferase